MLLPPTGLSGSCYSVVAVSSPGNRLISAEMSRMRGHVMTCSLKVYLMVKLLKSGLGKKRFGSRVCLGSVTRQEADHAEVLVIVCEECRLSPGRGPVSSLEVERREKAVAHLS